MVTKVDDSSERVYRSGVTEPTTLVTPRSIVTELRRVADQYADEPPHMLAQRVAHLMADYIEGEMLLKDRGRG